MTTSDPAASATCQSCGAALPSDSRFCLQCGQAVAAGAAQSPAADAEPTPPVQSLTPPSAVPETVPAPQVPYYQRVSNSPAPPTATTPRAGRQGSGSAYRVRSLTRAHLRGHRHLHYTGTLDFWNGGRLPNGGEDQRGVGGSPEAMPLVRRTGPGAGIRLPPLRSGPFTAVTAPSPPGSPDLRSSLLQASLRENI